MLDLVVKRFDGIKAWACRMVAEVMNARQRLINLKWYISALRPDSRTVRKAISMFSDTRNTYRLIRRHSNVTGSRKTNMVVAKPEVPISQLLDKIAVPFQMS